MEHRIIDQQLDVLRDKVLLLGGATETALKRAMHSLLTRDSQLAQSVLDEDEVIDRMELEIDRMSVEILALQQPAAHDLRLVIAVAKIIPCLSESLITPEYRRAALIINEEPQLKSFGRSFFVAENAREMLSEVSTHYLGEWRIRP